MVTGFIFQFLHDEKRQYPLIPVAPASGEPERVSSILPGDSLRQSRPSDLRRAVAEEIAAALRILVLLAVYRELASDRAGYLRAVGIVGLIARSLMGYSNPEDGDAVIAIGRLATENLDLDMPILRKSAAHALNPHQRGDARAHHLAGQRRSRGGRPGVTWDLPVCP